MGYCIDQVDAKFRIPADKCDAALAAIKAMPRDECMWVSGFHDAKTLSGAMREWRYNLRVDGDNSVVGITFVGEKHGDCIVLFRAIAPYVDAGSYIEMRGEDGAVWRWVFDGKSCQAKYSRLDWVD